ncbi:hypothetical protein MRB53_036332 [Persea americana]|nr:hypothetical protein MRB53_036409 [Persea americana]KAJ8614919.1 hypothetical protein MRB53_036332 [Persea americana]
MEPDKLLDQRVPKKPGPLLLMFIHVYAGESTETAFTSAPATRGSVTGQRKAETGNGFLTSSSLRVAPSYACSPAPVYDVYAY